MSANLTLTVSKRYVVARPRADQWSKIDRVNKDLLKRFFRNVRWLMRTRQISQRKLERDILCELGFKISRGAAKKYIENPTYVNASLSYLTVYCIYFKEPLGRMLNSDYEYDSYYGDYTRLV